MNSMSYSALDTQLGYPSPPISMADDRRSVRSVETGDFPYDQALGTRIMCICALVACWLAGLSVIGFGCYVFYLIHTGNVKYWYLPHMAAESIPLATNLVVTLLVDGTGFIHTASLRWSMQREGRLTFNSNLRLLSCSRRSGPNRWYSNFIVLAAIILAYTSSSLTFWHSNHAADVTDIFLLQQDSVSVGGIPVLALGLCFLILAAMSTWALVATKIPSWSSSPLDTAYAAYRAGSIARSKYRCMRSVHDERQPSIPVVPSATQRGALSAHWEVRWVLFMLWTLVFFCFGWAGLTSHLIETLQPEISGFGSWSLFPGGYSSQLYLAPAIESPVVNALCIIALYAVLQAPLTLGLHCAELVMNLSRDEAFWRKATRAKGCRLEDYNSIKASFTSWQSISLAGCKTVMHWVFGLCVQVHNGKIYFGSVQIVYLGFLATICATYVTYVSMRKPKGPQPAAYGHLQTLVNLVDTWSATVHWGHKEDGYQAAHAGTAHYRLPPVKPVPYCG